MEVLLPLLACMGAFMLWPVVQPHVSLSTIYGAEGEHPVPYMTRLIIGRLRFHIFHRGDWDPDPHNHPWGFWTFPLTSYIEEVTLPVDDEHPEGAFWCKVELGYIRYFVLVRAWRFHYRLSSHTHRVLGRAALPPWYHGLHPLSNYSLVTGPIFTIVWREAADRDWGFLKLRDGRWCWEPWRSYVFGGGKAAPCAD